MRGDRKPADEFPLGRRSRGNARQENEKEPEQLGTGGVAPFFKRAAVAVGKQRRAGALRVRRQNRGGALQPERDGGGRSRSKPLAEFSADVRNAARPRMLVDGNAGGLRQRDDAAPAENHGEQRRRGAQRMRRKRQHREKRKTFPREKRRRGNVSKNARARKTVLRRRRPSPCWRPWRDATSCAPPCWDG